MQEALASQHTLFFFHMEVEESWKLISSPGSLLVFFHISGFSLISCLVAFFRARRLLGFEAKYVKIAIKLHRELGLH